MAHWNAYVGCFTDDLWNFFPRPDPDTSLPSDGVEHLLFDDATGRASHVRSTGGLRSPQYLAVHPTLRVVYAAEFTEPGRLTAFRVGTEGELVRTSEAETAGILAASVCIHPEGSFAYVGHLNGGLLATVPLDPEGSIVDADCVAAARPSPAAARLHQVLCTPGGGELIAVDYGRDEICTYRIGDDGSPSRQPVTTVAFPGGSGTRHLEFHPGGRIVYVVGEYDGKLYVLEAENFVPRRILSSHSVAPPGYAGKCLPSELHLHPDGRTLFVGVRRADCIAVFDVDDSGGVVPLHHESSFGADPRCVRIDPSGRHLLVGNWRSNNTVTFRIGGDRHLSLVEDVGTTNSPSSIVFLDVSTYPLSPDRRSERISVV